MFKRIIILLILLSHAWMGKVAHGVTFPCWYEVKDGKVVHVKFAGNTIMRLRRVGSIDPEEKARKFAEKINLLWERGLLFRNFEISAVKSGHIIKYKDEEILKVTEEEARDNNTNSFHLAVVWLNNLCASMAELQSYRLWSRNTSHPRIIEGVASWYGSEWNKRMTASGEVYWDRKLIAASKTLPFNSLVKVTDVNTGRWVIVRIVDRGPFVKGRIIDLSTAAAEVLQIKRRGLANVRIEVIQWDDRFGGKR